MGLISGCRYLKVNLKANIYIYVNSTIQWCPNRIIKIFLIEDFFHLPPVSTTPVVNLDLRISPRIVEKIRNGPIGILWGWGETDSRKKQKRKISWHCPFKRISRKRQKYLIVFKECSKSLQAYTDLTPILEWFYLYEDVLEYVKSI